MAFEIGPEGLARDIVPDANATLHRGQSIDAFHIGRAALDNAKMHKRDNPLAIRFAAAIERLCREKAEAEPAAGLLKPDGSLHHNQIAAHIAKATDSNFHQSTLTRILGRKISNPTRETLRSLATYFEMSVEELRQQYESPQLTTLRKLSVAQISIAEKWASLPPRARHLIAEQLDRWLQLLKEDPQLLQAIVTTEQPLVLHPKRAPRRNTGHHDP